MWCVIFDGWKLKILDNGDVDVISSIFGGKCVSVMLVLVVVIG